MTYESIVKKMKEFYALNNASEINGHFAAQFNVTGEGEGIFFLEVVDGNISVEPYDYVDRDLCVTADASVLIQIADQKVTMKDAVQNGTIALEGSRVEEFLTLKPAKAAEEAAAPAVEAVVEEAKPAKEPAKKPAAKKTTTKKAAAKKTAEKTTEKKPAAKKTTARKTTAKKAE